MAIGDDTAIDYTNKIIDLTGVTVYDVSVLYSYCKEQFKLSPNIDDDFAWKANTATDFTLQNGWVFRARGVRRLKNGGIRSVYGTDELIKLTFQAGGYTNAIDTDIGKEVNGGDLGATDFLVDYDNTKRVWYVRTSGVDRTVGSSVAITITAGTGAGTTSVAGVQSTTGEDDLWTNFNTIGDLAQTGPQPLIYVYTGDLTTGDFAGNARRNEGYEDDPDPSLTNSDRGVFDGLIRIKDMGVTLGNPVGFVRLYGRQGLDKFADFPIDGSAGGRIAVPIAQSNDTEDTIGEVWLAIDGRNATDPAAGETVTWTGTNSAEVVSFIEGAASTNGVVQLRGLTDYPANNTALTFSGGATGNSRGTVGGQLITIDAETAQVDEADYGNVLTGGTSSSKCLARGHLTLTETGTGQGYIIAESNHDLKADSTYYSDFQDNDNITGTGVDVTADFGTTAYSRLAFDLDDVQIKLAAWDLTVGSTASFAVGDNITQATSLAKGTIISIPDSTSLIVSWNNTTAFNGTNNIDDDDSADTTTCSNAARVNTFSYTLSLQSPQTYYGLINCNGRTAAETFHYIKYFQQARATAANSDPNTVNADADQHRYLTMMKEELGAGGLIAQAIEGEEYFRAFTDEDTPANSPTDQSPDSRIAVKPGASITTGQGWALIDIAGADANNFTLTATNGTKHSPLISVSVEVTNLQVPYHVEVALQSGGQENKAQITSGVGNTAGATSFVCNATLPNDTPTGAGNSGVLKVIDNSSTSTINREMRYRYSSYSGTTITLATGGTGQAEASSSGNTLVDTAAFANVEVGDPIRNTTDGSIAWVKEKTDANTIVTTQLEGGTSNDWANLDNWESNTLVVAYVDGVDQGYIPYIDRVATGATESETLTFVTDRSVIIVVRDTSIDDFITTSTINSSGMSVGAVQNSDDIYAP